MLVQKLIVFGGAAHTAPFLTYYYSIFPSKNQEKMNKKIQDALDAQIQQKRAAQVVEASEAPALTSDVFEKDDRKVPSLR